jgi:N-acetylglucosaminyldiphosphoundecaprenol N-acetyl-beta-D-mannosaminyltransferase
VVNGGDSAAHHEFVATADASRASPPAVGYSVDCAGVPISWLGRSEASEWLIACALDGPGTPMDVHLCNAYTLALADRRRDLADVLTRSGLNLPDGVSVTLATRVVHGNAHGPYTRIRGTDLLYDIFETGTKYELRHFLLGSTPDVLASMQANLSTWFPGVRIVGTDSPPYREPTEAERELQHDRILQSGAHVVWVGLGTPKQDFEVARLARELPLVFIAVGAAFDFVAGKKSEAPTWVQRVGFEWLHRLLSEPRRLWRRYLFGNVRFVWAVLRGARHASRRRA